MHVLIIMVELSTISSATEKPELVNLSFSTSEIAELALQPKLRREIFSVS